MDQKTYDILNFLCDCTYPPTASLTCGKNGISGERYLRIQLVNPKNYVRYLTMLINLLYR